MVKARKDLVLGAVVIATVASVIGCAGGKSSSSSAPPPPPPPSLTCALTVQPNKIHEGQSATLRWTAPNATEVDLQPAAGRQQASGSLEVTPRKSTTYTMSATGAGATVTCTADIEVIRAEAAAKLPPPPADVFPWPPPKWTLKYPIPDALVVRPSNDQQATLGEAFKRIQQAMTQAGIDQWSVYPIDGSEGDHGFVAVSRPENIRDDGSWKSLRFCINDCKLENISLGSVLRALFSANAGRYRVIALVVTDLPIQAGGEPPTPEQMERFVTLGPSRLAPEVAASPVKATMFCEALIYEFYRPNPGTLPQAVDPSSLSAIQHLVGAGLWTKEDLQR